MKSILNIWYLSIAIIFTGCATKIDSLRLERNAPPIKDVSIIIGLGNLSSVNVASSTEKSFYQTKLPEGLMTRLPAIFSKNEIALQGLVIQQKLIADHEVPPLLEKTKATHLLVVRPFSTSYVADSYGGRMSDISVNFETTLWDVSLRKPVWRAIPKLKLLKNQPLLTSQEFAGMLLKGLFRDGFLSLRQGFPIDLDGKEIMHNWGTGNDK